MRLRFVSARWSHGLPVRCHRATSILSRPSLLRAPQSSSSSSQQISQSQQSLLPPPSVFLPARSFATKAKKSKAERAEARASKAEAKAQEGKDGDAAVWAFNMRGVTKRLPTGRQLFERVDLSFYHGAKIGIVGSNGAGKSSLLKIIAGVDKEFEGEAKAKEGFKVGYLEQEPDLDASKTVEEHLLDGVRDKLALLDDFERISNQCATATDEELDQLMKEQARIQLLIDQCDAWNLANTVKQAAAALRCPPGDSQVTNLSGGEKRRVALCRLLLSAPDILLLDEPTNHLDAESVTWLEGFLAKYEGLVITITHDRYFLDNIAGWILEIEGGQCHPFKGNYAAWLESKAGRKQLGARLDAKKERLYQKELEWMRGGAKGSKSREKRLAQMSAERDAAREARANSLIEGGGLIMPDSLFMGRDTIDIQNLGVTFQDNGRVLFKGLNLSIKAGTRLGIVGPNGSGKTTLLKCIVGDREPTEGRVVIGKHINFGYTTQGRDSLNEDNTVWNEIVGSADVVQLNASVTIPARQYVSQFNFTGPQQMKRLGQLSGGERNRVHLAKALLRGCNVMILDEPTNDLDIDTLQKLEQALLAYDGAAILVSHDRAFLDRVTNQTLAHEGDSWYLYDGPYSEYEQEYRARMGSAFVPLEKRLSSSFTAFA